jgi:polar amino acid transport system substrate-binding protein
LTARRFAFVGLVLALSASVGGCAASRDAARGSFTPEHEGVLTVAASIPAPGFWDSDDEGFEWGLAQALADRFDLRLEVVNVPFQQIVDGDLGGADLALSQISITDERGKVLDFSVPYYDTAPGVLALAGTDIDDLATAKEQHWVAVAGSTEADYLEDVVHPDATWTAVDDETAAASDVLAGRADAALMDLPTALVLARREPGLDVVARFATSERYGVALPDGSTSNVEAVDAAIRSMQADGSLQDLTERWLRPALGTNPDDIKVVRTPDP